MFADTESKSDASDVAAIVNGLRGLISLAGDMEDVPEIVRRVVADARAEADENRVSVRLAVPIRELRELIERETGMRTRRERVRDERESGEDDRRGRGDRRDRRRRRDDR